MNPRAWLSPERLSIDRIAVLCWLVAAAIGLVVYRDAIATLGLRDADDSLRLVQVRDLLAGQSWFDVTQYRINPAEGGGLMHWSRFVDVQIAALIWLFGLVLAPDAAERWAVGIYPLLLILPLFLLLGRILSILGDRRQAIAGLLVATTAITFLHYFAPLRIDHHNWQLLLSVAMLWLALDAPTFRRGVAAALVITAHVEISLEGLPYLVIFGALFALEWLRDPRGAPRLAGFAAGLVVIPAAWLLLFRGWQSLATIYCDSFSLPYVAGTAVAASILFAGTQFSAMGASWRQRALLLGLAGLAGGATFLMLGRVCLDGPFGDLEPLVRIYWYDQVMEGRPLWVQRPDIALLWLMPTLVGLGATLWAWARAQHTIGAENWSRVLLVVLTSSLLSMLVFRTGATTHAYLIPAFGALAAGLWGWSRARATALRRIGGAMLVLTAIPAVDAFVAASAAKRILPGRLDTSAAERAAKQETCPSTAMLLPLRSAPPALIFASIDIGPELLVRTRHRVIATGHHRNHAAMNRVITAFLSEPAAARPIVQASGARLLAVCTQLPEMQSYADAKPGGLAARLSRGETVDWLVYDPTLSSGEFRAYRIRR
ncbi:hypothetical protein ATE67_17695 [Sphingopyxis sp. H050]|jgi:hypothetical protein|uniref:hypothetical protein n=1 Tax=Sphingopyxis sp. H050 TaxID=1759072 RepID=UPI000735E3E7|nr:hypothetical protein [Sphingopyxis sp. H050]KTE18537.1 hypothetical protein ATE67_17695 [Sphingopyxis sp. H050]